MRFLSAALGAVFLWPVPSAAQSPPVPMVCGPRAVIAEKLAADYAERLVNIGVAGSGALLEVFAAESGSWSIVVTLPDGTSCLVATGEDWETVPKLVEPEGTAA